MSHDGRRPGADGAPRVLHVVPAIAARYGGPSTAVLGMCRALRAAGADALVATTDADGPGRLAVTPGAVTAVDGVPVIVFPRVASESFKWSPRLTRWLNREVRRFDVVHVHAVFSHASLAAGRAARAAGVPYVVRPLGTLDPWSLGHHALRKRLLMRVGVRRLLTGAAAMHYTAREEQRLVEGPLPFVAPGVVVPLAVDDALFAAPQVVRAEGHPPNVLAVARLDAKKGLDLLIDAFHDTAVGELAHWTLTIAGSGEAAYEAWLRRRAAAGAASSRIVFAGWVDTRERRALLQAASCFALPSQQENFGIAVVEALAAGVPVVVTPGVNLAHDIDAAGAGWVSPRTRSGLAETLRTAMSRPDERTRRGGAARGFAEQFRWPSVGRGLLAMYEQVARPCVA